MNSLERFDQLTAYVKASKEKKAKRLAKRKELGLPDKKKRKKSPSHAKIEKLAWDAFSKWIRARDGQACWTCGNTGVIEAGHIISRRRRATKYHEDCVHSQCQPCNWKDKFLPGYHDLCVSIFIKKMGLEKYQGLVELSRTTLQHSKADLLAIAEKYSPRPAEAQSLQNGQTGS